MNFKEWQRPVLLLAMAVVGVLLLIEWQDFQKRRMPAVETTTTVTTPSADSVFPVESSPADQDNQNSTDTVPVVSNTVAAMDTIPTTDVTNPAPSKRLIEVKTDTQTVMIDTVGGDIVKVALPKYPVSIDSPNEPLILLNRNDSNLYIAKSGLVGGSVNVGQINNVKPLNFQASKYDYILPTGQDKIVVDLTMQLRPDVSVIKRFTFHRGDYAINVEFLINNQSQTSLTTRLYGQIVRDDHAPPKTGPGFGIKSFLGVATTTPETRYEKFNFDDISDSDFKAKYRNGYQFQMDGGWMAMVQHYFVSAWIPPQDKTNSFVIKESATPRQYAFGFLGPAVDIAAGEEKTLQASFYSGPKDIERFEELASYLDRTLDFSWLFFIARPMFLFLLWIHNFVANWGLAIILLVLCIKALFYPLASAGFRSMAKMKVFAPKMAELKERYGDNKQKFSEEMMKLYKKEGVNPVGGCLPMLLQIPVFISLYWVILEAVDLRHAPFIFWIKDLSDQDPFFILPLLYGLIMWFQQKLNPAMGDPTQQKIMQMMPIVFTAMFLFFPAGLVLYWVVNQLLSILQQWYITKQIEKSQGAKKA